MNYCVADGGLCDPENVRETCCGGLACKRLPGSTTASRAPELAYRCVVEEPKLRDALPCIRDDDCASGYCEKTACQLHEVVRDASCAQTQGACAPFKNEVNRFRDFHKGN